MFYSQIILKLYLFSLRISNPNLQKKTANPIWVEKIILKAGFIKKLLLMKE